MPRRTKVTAVVLGAALVQVGLLAFLGLKSTRDRLEARRQELAGLTRQVIQRRLVGGARERLLALENEARAPLRGTGTPRERVRRALGAMEDLAQARVFEHAFLVDETGLLWHADRPWLEPPESLVDEVARKRLAVLIDLEHTDARAARVSARALAEDIHERPDRERDTVAAARALRIAWRAALRDGDPSEARQVAAEVLGRYAALRDDRPAPLADAGPFGVSAAALLCTVLREVIHISEAHRDEFVQTLKDRRRLLQRLHPPLPEPVLALEIAACKALLPTLELRPAERRDLEREFAFCDAVDRELAVVASVPEARFKSMLVKGEYGPILLEDDGVQRTALVLPVTPADPSAPRMAAVFLARSETLQAYTLAAIRPRQNELPEGVGLLVRDAHEATLFGDPEAPSFLLPWIPFGEAGPGLKAGAYLHDPEALDRELSRERSIWLWTLAGAALAVVAASLLAIRAVLRELRLAKLKSDFVSNLSHELRTPLTSLRMFVETLQEGRVRDEAERAECLGIIAQETGRLCGLVDRILQFAAYSKGRAPVSMQPSDVGEVVERAVGVFRRRAEQAGARLDLAVEQELPSAIVDRDAIVQVVLNLLDNAVKYRGQDGGNIRVSVRATGSRVRIDVEDDGPGVPVRERERVFEEFYRGDDSLASRVQGTGIGLALCRRIMNAHGGTIEVGVSRDLGGALFRVTLPDEATGRRLAARGAGGT